MKIVRAVFIDKHSKSHSLYYRLYDTGLADRWLSLTRRNQKENKHLTSRLTNRTWQDLPEITREFNKLVGEINSNYDRQLPQYKELDRDKLNDLHEEFELYGTRIEELWANKTYTEERHQQFLRLNDNIHLVEDVLKTKTRPWPSFAMLYDYTPQEYHLPITIEDKFWLRPALQWGKLYLGYNTLGKDWLKVEMDDDREVVERDMVMTQERFAAEAWLNFGPDQDHDLNLQRFHYWYKSLPEELQVKVPIHDPHTLSLGRFILGELIIDDYFLSFHDKEEDWALARSPCKLKWSLEVFSTFRALDKIEIVRE
jgi:hypothetical protein